MTALYAAILLSLAFVLSWRSLSYEREFNRLVSVDSARISALRDLHRAQSAWRNGWAPIVDSTKEDATAQAERFGSILQLFEARNLSGPSMTRVRDGMIGLATWSRERASEWDRLRREERAIVISAVEQRSDELTDRITLEVDRARRDLDTTLSSLAERASGTMWTALGTAYIIAIVSFVAARRTLAKVVRPLEDLSRASERIAAGDLDSRAPVAGDLEIAQLGESFNRMTEALRDSHTELRRRARTDDLTGLPNFRAFRETIDGEMERSSRSKKPFGILILDLDHFKKYNDTYGHLAGNEALQLVSETIREKVRNIDFPARYGGEEFAVIAPESDIEGLHILAERVRAAVAALPPIADRRPLTVSIGGALYPLDSDDTEGLFTIADERLYRAKELGRNRSVVGGSGADSASVPTSA